MGKITLIVIVLSFSIISANAQVNVLKLVGNDTKDYTIGFGAFLKAGFPVSDAADITAEFAADIFLQGGFDSQYGTFMCPLKGGYRYTLDKSGGGFYLEPQVGFNVLGLSTVPDKNGNAVNLHYHGVVFAAGGGYLFQLWQTPFDLNLRYETIMAHGGSNNFISLGISRSFSFKKRDSNY